MATYQALGTGPISFLDGNQSQQEIPLSAIVFGPSGVDASAWPDYTKNQTVIDALLKQMVQQSLLAPGTAAAPVVSLTLTAVQPGPEGNTIIVTFSNPSSAAGTITVSVSVTETYHGLTPATFVKTLSTANSLVSVPNQTKGNPMPLATTGLITGTGANSTLIVPDQANDATGAFTLAAVDNTYDLNITVTIDPVTAPNPPTFSFQSTATKTVSGATLANLLSGTANPFKAVVTFAQPTGAPFPEAGTVTLQGGANASSTPAAQASASAYSS